MNKFFNRFGCKWLFWVMLVLLFTVVFKWNVLDSFNRNFDNFQYDSEDLAIGVIAAAHYDINCRKAGLGRLQERDVDYKKTNPFVSESLYRENNPNKAFVFHPYDSQIGLQGKFYKSISEMIYSPKLTGVFRGVNCFLLANVIVSVVYLLKRKYGVLLAAIWGGTFLFSPWIVNFARNLYWVEFTWFIPMLLGLFAVSDISFRHKYKLIFLGTFISVSIKSACGYEYLSTILMAMAMFPMVEIISSCFEQKYDRALFFTKVLVGMALSGLGGFLVALLCHAYVRGDKDVYEGLISIYKRDVLRRTALGNNSNFVSSNSFLMQSVNASIWHVLNRYFDYYTNAFHSNIVLGLDGRYFKTMTVVALSLSILRVRFNKFNQLNNIKYFSLLIISLLSSVSWFVLAKSHSYVHTHMNYVLWFFGYVQMCLFIIIDSGLKFFKMYIRSAEDE